MENQNKISRLVVDDTIYDTKLTKKFLNRKPYLAKDPKKVHAFIPGIIKSINVKKGQTVKEGDLLLTLEAMKMKNAVTSHCDGRIKEIHIAAGNMVLKDQTLIEFE
jgi:biotin carboxyl carrier protein